MKYHKIKVPARGARITVNSDSSLKVPDVPIIPCIEGDGIGVEITPVMYTVLDAAVKAGMSLRYFRFVCKLQLLKQIFLIYRELQQVCH